MYFKENALAPPIARSRAIAFIPTIVESGEAEQSSHLFTWCIKSNWRAVPVANVYFTPHVIRHRPLEATLMAGYTFTTTL